MFADKIADRQESDSDAGMDFGSIVRSPETDNVVPFAGDVSGDYELDLEDFGWTNDDHEKLDILSSTSSDSEDMLKYIDHNEEIVGPNIAVRPGSPQLVQDEPNEFPAQRSISPSGTSTQALTGDPKRPRYVERYPSTSAGAPIGEHGVPINQQYMNMLNNAENIYAPFTSKIDWEMAHWANHHAISSTAISELLAIEGVSISLTRVCFD
jgi:hypothetical protein